VTAVRQDQLLRLLEQLPQREQAIVDLVGRFRIVQSGQVERLFFIGSASPAAGRRHCRRQLARLVELGLLRRLERRIGGVRAGSAGHLYTLAPAGRRLHALSRGRDAASDRGVHEPGLAFVRHTLAVTELFVHLRETERAEALELLDFQPEPECWRSYTLASGASGWLKPDAYARLAVGEWEERSFVEVDLGTEGRAALTRKLRAYLAYYHSGREQTAEGVFPRVTFLTTTKARAEAIATLASTLTAPGLLVSGRLEDGPAILSGHAAGKDVA
jgi:Replication-relaxation